MLIQVLIPLKQWMGQNFKNMAPSMRQLSHFLTFWKPNFAAKWATLRTWKIVW